MRTGLLVKTANDRATNSTRPYRAIREVALQAEADGFDSIWVCDHMLHRRAGEPTQGIWECWTVLILGIGAGWNEPEYQAFGLPFDHRVSRLDEAVQILRPLLRDGHVDFAGQYYQAPDCEDVPRGPRAADAGQHGADRAVVS
jgi:alkanesulfonate monooxygenase SsuD/methylene tetrahydromethanopterin reductase-like flavin-dependent oxidoreductase (luciferase family)